MLANQSFPNVECAKDNTAINCLAEVKDTIGLQNALDGLNGLGDVGGEGEHNRRDIRLIEEVQFAFLVALQDRKEAVKT